jgi:hypothetical protein
MGVLDECEALVQISTNERCRLGEGAEARQNWQLQQQPVSTPSCPKKIQNRCQIFRGKTFAFVMVLVVQVKRDYVASIKRHGLVTKEN